MSHETDIQNLLDEEAELLVRVTALREDRARIEKTKASEEKELADEEERDKQIDVLVVAVSGGQLILESLFRPDVLKVWQSIPNRSYRGYAQGYQSKFGEPNVEVPGRNQIPIIEWPETRKKLEALHNTAILWSDGTEERYEWLVNAPPWEIDVDEEGRGKFLFICKAGPNEKRYADNHQLGFVPGVLWNYDEDSFSIPLSEGWRIPEALSKIEGVVYSDAARVMIFQQVEDRAELDLIARKEDSDFFTHLNGHPLRSFQKVAVEFMVKCGGRMICADPTGVGKTWETLGFAEYHRAKDASFVTLCVVKGANIRNWVREIRRLTGLDPVICKNETKIKNVAYHRIMGEKANYILISHDMLGTYEEEDGVKTYGWAELFKMIDPDLVIVDEAHLIKNPDTHRSKATRSLSGCRFIIPATASPVLNRTEELWPLLSMVNPAMFGSHQSFNFTYTHDGKVPKNIEKLHEMLRPIFLRRERSVIQKDLPPINRIQKIYELSDEGKATYDRALDGFWKEMKTFDPRGVGRGEMPIMNFLAQVTRLKQICAADKTEYTADLAAEIINENPDGGKVLIFTHFKGVAVEIASRLGHEAVCTVERTERDFYSMTADERDELFESIRHRESIKYLVTTEASGIGMNLEFCDWVIFNDQFWTPAAHDQCEGRAYGRLSNPHTIDSFYVVADTQIEEWIQEMLETKLEIISATVEGVECSRDVTGSIAKELMDRMMAEMYKKAS